MKAKVQYNDYYGTTAADRSDWLNNNREHVTKFIVDKFGIPIDASKYQYLGVSVYGTTVECVCAEFYFREITTSSIIKYSKLNVKMQSILELFKRFEFQIGEHLDNIDEANVVEIDE